jgi:manganese-dependent inorganic pyrophosphatase
VGGGRTIAIAQVETVGATLAERKEELLHALEDVRDRGGHDLAALMITDIVSKGTELLVAGDVAPVERTFGVEPQDGTVFLLPGVMSRKKQVAPKLLSAF